MVYNIETLCRMFNYDVGNNLRLRTVDEVPQKPFNMTSKCDARSELALEDPFTRPSRSFSKPALKWGVKSTTLRSR